MEGEYEILKKYFIDKEKENIQLKEELEKIKSKININDSAKSEVDTGCINITNIPFTKRIVSSNTHQYQNQETSTNANLTTNFHESKIEDNFQTSGLVPRSSIMLPKENIEETRISGMVFQKLNKRSKSEINFNREIFTNTSPNNNLNVINFNSNSQLDERGRNKVNQSPSVRGSNLNFYEMGKFYDERSRSNNSCNNMMISANKGVIKNIETNISELKKFLNTYEKAYENINHKLDTSGIEQLNISSSPKISNELKSRSLKKGFENIKSSDLILTPLTPASNSNINIKQEHDQFSSTSPRVNSNSLNKIKEFYENELKMKSEIYNQNINLLNQAHSEDIKKMRLDYEDKIEQIIKRSEEEKMQLIGRIHQLEHETAMRDLKLEFAANEKNEVIEFQKKYLNEMKDLQKAFEDFKKQTYEEFKILQKSKEDAIKNANYYKDSYDRLKEENEQTEGLYKDNFKLLKSKVESMKILVKNNEVLKTQLEVSRSEINFLKSKIDKIENMQGLLNTNGELGTLINNINNLNNYHNTPQHSSYKKNSNYEMSNFEKNMLSAGGSNNRNFQNIQTEMNYLTEGGESIVRNNLFSNKSSDIVNYQNFSNTGSILSPHTARTDPRTVSPIPLGHDNSNFYTDRKTLSVLEENTYKVIDLKKAHQKIKEMEDCLKSMNNENENLKDKLGSVISNMSQTDMNMNQSSRKSSQNTPVISEANSMNSARQLCTPNKRRSSNIDREEIKYSASFRNTKESHHRDLTPPVVKSSLNQNNNFYTLRNFPPEEKPSHKDYYNHVAPCQREREFNKHILTKSRCSSEAEDDLDLQETIDDNIIEFPLQLKIKGKIKKISTNKQKYDS